MKVSYMKSNNIRYKLAWGNLRVLISDTVYENRKMFQTRLCKYNMLKY